MPPGYEQTGDPLGQLHSFYDGRPPWRTRQEALAGGPAALEALRAEAAQRRAVEQYGAARLAVVRRRALLTRLQCRRDRWLARLVADLARLRADAVGMRG
ncbi:hypothetical protein [Niveispirillum sp. BGYR6]|uniref:hypothetical protein n=1 Tax=Niveispirillum sp. BGYR6 TaxID=2971249 RepID=UPI0022B98272|nr:hypothetical protein [Niveispirillum sp. BGYR6]MDG5495933.1 hypothetical protein [Niveispirillum sp. BGYR6]